MLAAQRLLTQPETDFRIPFFLGDPHIMGNPKMQAFSARSENSRF